MTLTATTRNPREIDDLISLLQRDVSAARRHAHRCLVLLAAMPLSTGFARGAEVERQVDELEQWVMKLRASVASDAADAFHWVPEDLADRP
jgi:hypothetical protein